MPTRKGAKTGPARLNFLYTNIGRGHPFYLDGITEALIRTQHIGLVRNETDVFQISHGASAFAWKLARWLYRRGSSPGLVSRLYAGLRSDRDYNRPGLMTRIMGRDLRSEFIADSNPLIVAHPLLVGLLAGKSDLLYQHGEVVVPAESLVMGASVVIVPTTEVAESFYNAGYDSEQVIISGLCIEPSLVRQASDAFDIRMARLQSEQNLTGVYFSSGAEPRQHVDRLVAAAVAAIRSGGNAIIFVCREGLLNSRAVAALRKTSINFGTIGSTDAIPADLPRALIVRFSSRREETLVTAHLFPRFDYLVGPSHERSNWALGLGLPMFITGPSIGPFSPLNSRLLQESGVAESIDSNVDAYLLGSRLDRLRQEGQLVKMAQAGWGVSDIDGFAKISEFLVNKYVSNT